MQARKRIRDMFKFAINFFCYFSLGHHLDHMLEHTQDIPDLVNIHHRRHHSVDDGHRVQHFRDGHGHHRSHLHGGRNSRTQRWL